MIVAAAPRNRGKLIAIGVLVLLVIAGGYRAYLLVSRQHVPAGPAQITQISHWHKPISEAILSPNGHTVAFTSYTQGYEQVFVMLTSGGDPLQLTTDEGSKTLNSFSADGTHIYYQRELGASEVCPYPRSAELPPESWMGSPSHPRQTARASSTTILGTTR